MVRLEIEQSFSKRLLRSNSTVLTQADFAPWTTAMVPATAQEFTTSLRKALVQNADTDTKSPVWSLTFFDALTGSGYVFTDEPAVVDRRFSFDRAGVDQAEGRDRLLLDLRFKANLNVVDAATEGPHLVAIGRIIRFALVPEVAPDGDVEWLIDAWNGRFTVSAPAERPSGRELDTSVRFMGQR